MDYEYRYFKELDALTQLELVKRYIEKGWTENEDLECICEEVIARTSNYEILAIKVDGKWDLAMSGKAIESVSDLAEEFHKELDVHELEVQLVWDYICDYMTTILAFDYEGVRYYECCDGIDESMNTLANLVEAAAWNLSCESTDNLFKVKALERLAIILKGEK